MRPWPVPFRASSDRADPADPDMAVAIVSASAGGLSLAGSTQKRPRGEAGGRFLEDPEDPGVVGD
jgi:hypothetical protein